MDNPNQQNTPVTGEVITNSQSPIVQPKSHKTLIIVILVIVTLLICCTFSAIAASFLIANTTKANSDRANDLNATASVLITSINQTAPAKTKAEIKEPNFNAMPGGAVCDATLCNDVWYGGIVPSTQIYADCKELELQDTTLDSKTTGYTSWEETWILNGCGKDFPFKVSYTTDPNGGTNYVVTKKF